MKFLLSIFLIPVFCISAHGFHPTHMSVVNMHVEHDSLHITYTIRIFQDDMNHLIASLYHEELFHSSDTFDLNMNSEKIDNYFLDNFKVKTNGNYLQPELIKKESGEKEYCLSYKLKLAEIPKTMLIENKILIDFYSDQTNLLIYSYLNNEKGTTFNANTKSKTIKLDNN